MPSPPYVPLEKELLSTQLRPGDRVFANGETANNHLDMGYEEVPRLTRSVIPSALVNVVMKANIEPTFVAAVPSGANGWGKRLAANLNVGREERMPLLKFSKLDRRVFEPTTATRKRIRKLRGRTVGQGIVIDDASSDGGTSEALADLLTEQGLDVGLVLSVFFRGDIKALRSKYQRGALIARHLPLMMDWDVYRQTGSIQELNPSI